MRSTILALALVLVLTACGGGGGGGGSSGPTTPPPPPPPVDVVTPYSGTWYDRGGIFAAEGDTYAEWHSLDNRLVFETDALGWFTCYPTPSTTGWRAVVTKNGRDYSVWFWPEEDTLLVGDTDATSNFIGWTITPIAGSG